MRLDPTDLRYLSADEFRVLTATEMGSKNHEVVPSPLIAELSGLRGGNINKLCGQLAKRNLIARVQNAHYDGYRLTYGGLDYLALRTFSRRKPPSVAAVGKKIGVGKESDIYLVKDEAGENRVLKLHRLGRISFRSIKTKRDYLGKRSSASWMYMSRLAAQKEFAFMKVLYLHGFPVPTPIDQGRHCIVMSLVDSTPLRAVMHIENVAELYGQLMDLIMRFAHAGLIHGDFNEFNILIPDKGEPVVIDFPQMTSTRHENAESFFNRDVNCIRRFFRKRFRFEGTTWPVWADVLADLDESEAAAKAEAEAAEEAGEEGEASASTAAADDTHAPPGNPLRLDLEVEASGFGRAMQRELEHYQEEVGELPPSDPEYEDEEESDEDDDEIAEAEGDVEEAETEAAEVPKVLSPEEEAEAAAARLEKLRIHRALGNDGDPDDPEPEPVYSSAEGEDEDAAGSSSDESVGPAPSDFTQYTRASRAPRQRMKVSRLGGAGPSKLGAVDEMRSVVGAEIARDTRRTTATRMKKKAIVGNAKGHKWKTSASYLTGGS